MDFTIKGKTKRERERGRRGRETKKTKEERRATIRTREKRKRERERERERKSTSGWMKETRIGNARSRREETTRRNACQVPRTTDQPVGSWGTGACAT